MSLHDTVTGLALVDNHAHAIEPLSPAGFEKTFPGIFTEGVLDTRDARHTLNYRAVLGVLADRFGADPDAEAELLARRAEVDHAGYTRECIATTNTEAILVDEGFPGMPAGKFARNTDADVYPMLRLEPLIEALLSDHDEFAAFEAAFRNRLETALDGEYVALKTIAAYRRGLAIGPRDRAEARAAFADLSTDWNGRIEHPQLLDYCLHLALSIAGEYGSPVQFHTGFGDPDAHPRLVDPTHLVECIETHPETEFVVLHGGYPYVGQAAYVTATYPNVYLDLSLAIPFAQHGASRVVSTALEVVPTTKLLYGSDAFHTPELFVLAAQRFRDALAETLSGIVESGIISETYAETAARQILRSNAMELYGLN